MLQKIQNQTTILKILKEAINSINGNYIVQPYPMLVRQKLQRPERVFVAELYHQLRLFQHNNNPNLNNECDFHVELTKINFDEFQFNIELNKTNFDISKLNCINFVPKRISPDIVLHKSQDDSTPKNQILVCEVKMDGAKKNSIIKDLNKLIFYKVSRLQFQNAVFIYTGEHKRIETLLNQIQNSNLNTNLIKCLKKHNIIFCLRKDLKPKTWELYKIK